MSDRDKKLQQNARKQAQRMRDKLPGGMYEKPYRATFDEHSEIARTLLDMRGE